MGIINSDEFPDGIHHLVPEDTISKYQLLLFIAEAFGRDDLRINKFATPESVDRTLITKNIDLNLRFWNNAGYSIVPKINQLISESATIERGTQLAKPN